MRKRLLLIEDEVSLAKVIQLNLEMEEYEVASERDAISASERMTAEHFDLVILDLMLPGLSGMDFLRSLRVKNEEIPVIIISARDTSTDRIKGLRTGADDYLTKPFEIEELLIRIEKLLERKSENPETESTHVVRFGNCEVNFKTYMARKGLKNIQLSQKETHILKFLITHKNQVISRQEILKAVWGYDVFPSTRTIDNFIASLRKHLEDDPRSPEYIKSIHGVGYKFVME